MALFPGKKLAIVCFGFRGRREKFIELQERVFDKKNIAIFAKFEGGHDNIQYWKNTVQLGKMLEKFDPDIVHAYVDRTVLAAMSLEMKFPTVIGAFSGNSSNTISLASCIFIDMCILKPS